MCGGVLPACLSVHCTCTCYPKRPEEGIGSLTTVITGSCELPNLCLASNPGPLKEQPSTTKLSLHPLIIVF